MGRLAKGAPVKEAVPLGCVLMLPSASSEMNTFTVISRRGSSGKLAFGSPHMYAQVSVLDLEVTFTLPPPQVADGIVDAFAHVLEQYLTYPAGAEGAFQIRTAHLG